jgi:hypothetical protein
MSGRVGHAGPTFRFTQMGESQPTPLTQLGEDGDSLQHLPF